MAKRRVHIQLDVQQLALLILGTALFSGGLFAAGFVLGRDRRPPPLEVQIPVLTTQPTRPLRALPLGEVEFLFPSAPAPSAVAARPTPAVETPSLKAPETSSAKVMAKGSPKATAKVKSKATAKARTSARAQERARVSRRLAEIRALKRARASQDQVEDEDAPPRA
ncbi:hypothetical protein KKB55_04370 [Myxococcota bacterium]|nr:hypothetical protein [Myxococcota bacterium]MBU1896987.1 hypothetical protein [Myxococcota bacterium]